MIRKEIERLQHRVKAVKEQYKTGVSFIWPDFENENGGYILSCDAPGARMGDVLTQKSHHATIEEAQAAYNLFLQKHPPENGADVPLIIWDI